MYVRKSFLMSLELYFGLLFIGISLFFVFYDYSIGYSPYYRVLPGFAHFYATYITTLFGLMLYWAFQFGILGCYIYGHYQAKCFFVPFLGPAIAFGIIFGAVYYMFKSSFLEKNKRKIRRSLLVVLSILGLIHLVIGIPRSLAFRGRRAIQETKSPSPPTKASVIVRHLGYSIQSPRLLGCIFLFTNFCL